MFPWTQCPSCGRTFVRRQADLSASEYVWCKEIVPRTGFFLQSLPPLKIERRCLRATHGNFFRTVLADLLCPGDWPNLDRGYGNIRRVVCDTDSTLGPRAFFVFRVTIEAEHWQPGPDPLPGVTYRDVGVGALTNCGIGIEPEATLRAAVSGVMAKLPELWALVKHEPEATGKKLPAK